MNSIIDGSPDGKIPSSLMGQPTSADFGKSSETHGPPDVGSEIFDPKFQESSAKPSKETEPPVILQRRYKILGYHVHHSARDGRNCFHGCVQKDGRKCENLSGRMEVKYLQNHVKNMAKNIPNTFPKIRKAYLRSPSNIVERCFRQHSESTGGMTPQNC
jgi:hypothetical protein